MFSGDDRLQDSKDLFSLAELSSREDCIFFRKYVKTSLVMKLGLASKKLLSCLLSFWHLYFQAEPLVAVDNGAAAAAERLLVVPQQSRGWSLPHRMFSFGLHACGARRCWCGAGS